MTTWYRMRHYHLFAATCWLIDLLPRGRIRHLAAKPVRWFLGRWCIEVHETPDPAPYFLK